MDAVGASLGAMLNMVGAKQAEQHKRVRPYVDFRNLDPNCITTTVTSLTFNNCVGVGGTVDGTISFTDDGTAANLTVNLDFDASTATATIMMS